MLRKMIQISSFTCLLATAAAILPAAAAEWNGISEEDAAVPTGSFTSGMTVPMRTGHDHGFHFCHHHARAERHWGKHF